MQRSQESNGWLNYRLCVLGSSRKKRSYYLGWSRSEQRFARSTDSKDFANDLPALKTKLTKYLSRAAESLPDKAIRDIRVSSARDALKRIRASTAAKRLHWSNGCVVERNESGSKIVYLNFLRIDANNNVMNVYFHTKYTLVVDDMKKVN